MALRGGADVFYFMPGLRYFSSFNNLIFGETTYGYLLACTFIPYLILSNISGGNGNIHPLFSIISFAKLTGIATIISGSIEKLPSKPPIALLACTPENPRPRNRDPQPHDR